MKTKFVSLFFLVFLFFELCSNTIKPSSYSEYAKSMIVCDGRIQGAFMIPCKDIKVKNIVLGLIQKEAVEILAAQYVLNDKDIAQALCDAFERGVRVKVITDQSCLSHKNEQITLLKEKGIEVLVYSKPYSCMHHKFFVFEENFLKKPVLWTGSANATFSGFNRNQENVIVCDKAAWIDIFKKRFKTLSEEIVNRLTAKKNIEHVLTRGVKQLLSGARIR